MDAVDGQRGPGGEAFKVTALLWFVETLKSEGLFHFRDVDGEAGQGSAFQLVLWFNILIEAIDRNFAALILHAREQMNQGPEGIGHDSSPVARMQIPVGTLGTQFDIQDPSHTKADG